MSCTINSVLPSPPPTVALNTMGVLGANDCPSVGVVGKRDNGGFGDPVVRVKGNPFEVWLNESFTVREWGLVPVMVEATAEERVTVMTGWPGMVVSKVNGVRGVVSRRTSVVLLKLVPLIVSSVFALVGALEGVTLVNWGAGGVELLTVKDWGFDGREGVPGFSTMNVCGTVVLSPATVLPERVTPIVVGICVRSMPADRGVLSNRTILFVLKLVPVRVNTLDDPSLMMESGVISVSVGGDAGVELSVNVRAFDRIPVVPFFMVKEMVPGPSAVAWAGVSENWRDVKLWKTGSLVNWTVFPLVVFTSTNPPYV